MEGTRVIPLVPGPLLSIQLNPAESLQDSFCRTRLDAPETVRIFQDRTPEKRVTSHLLVRVTVTFVLPVPQNLFVTHQGNWQGTEVHNENLLT